MLLVILFRYDTDDAGLKLLRSLETVKFDVEEMRRQEKDLPAADSLLSSTRVIRPPDIVCRRT